MAAEDHRRVYYSTLKGGSRKFETEQEVIQYCKEVEGKFYPVKGLDYKYFSDKEEDKDKKGCAKVIGE